MDDQASPTPLTSLIALVLTATSGCALSHGDEVPPPMGDTSVFASIDVLIRVSEYQHRDSDARIPGELPPIRLGRGVHVTIDGGRSEGRVPGLRVFANGSEVDEVGSAADPPSFSYQYYPHYHVSEPLVRGDRTLLELRLDGASFHVWVDPLAGEITSPSSEASVSPDAPLLVRFTGGFGEAQVSMYAARAEGGGRCAVEYRVRAVREHEAELAPEWPADDTPRAGPPCSAEVEVGWGHPAEPLDTAIPTRSFEIERTLSLLHRFWIRDAS
jgi:hypothetical protein